MSLSSFRKKSSDNCDPARDVFSQKRGDKIANQTVGELRKILEGLPDDAEVFFSVDVDNWPETEEVAWDDDTRVMSVGWDSIHLDNAQGSYLRPRKITGLHFHIVGEFNSGDTGDTPCTT